MSTTHKELAESGLRPTVPIKKGSFDALKVGGITLIAVLALAILVPLLMTAVRVFFPDGSLDLSAFGKVMSDGAFWSAAKNTGVVVAVAGACALVVAFLLAWLNERTDAKLGWAGSVLPLVPLLMPGMALSIGWVFLGHPRVGFINNAIRAILLPFGFHAENGPIDIGTWAGLVFVYTLVLVPYGYLLISSALKAMDPSLEEASRMSGASPLTTILRVSLPSIRPAIASAALLMAVVGISFFSIPRTIGNLARIDVLSVYVVRLTQTYPSRLSEAVVISGVILVSVACLWAAQQRIIARSRHVTISGKASHATLINLGKWRFPARLALISYVLLAAVLPLAALVIVSVQAFWQPNISLENLTWEHYETFFSSGSQGLIALGNSIQLGVIAATIAMMIAAVTSVVVIKGRKRLAGAASLVTKVPGAISHLVIGVSVLVAFGGPPFNLAGTLAILLIAYVLMNMPQASIAAEDAAKRMGQDVLEASTMSGATDFRTSRWVVWPLMRPGLAAGWALVFAVVVGDLTASSILSGLRNPVVGQVFLVIWESGRFGELAVLGSVVCAVSALVVTLVLMFSGSRRWTARSFKNPRFPR